MDAPKTREELLDKIKKLEAELKKLECHICACHIEKSKCDYCKAWYCSERCGEECSACYLSACTECLNGDAAEDPWRYDTEEPISAEKLKELSQLSFRRYKNCSYLPYPLPVRKLFCNSCRKMCSCNKAWLCNTCALEVNVCSVCQLSRGIKRKIVS